jgi:protein ImuA
MISNAFASTSVPQGPRSRLGLLRQKLAAQCPASVGENSCFSQSTPGFGPDDSVQPLGLTAIDQTLSGGFAASTLHEFAPSAPQHLGATMGFALAVATLHARAPGPRQVLWITTDFAELEAGMPYGPGLDCFGLGSECVLILNVARPIDALWATEEALKSRALAAVITELPQEGSTADLTATRRLSLAARSGNGRSLLIRHKATPLSSAAMTRWEISSAPSVPDRFGGLGRTAFELVLKRNRRGPLGRFIVSWDHVARVFIPFTPQALSLGLAATTHDRPDHTRIARSG